MIFRRGKGERPANQPASAPAFAFCEHVHASAMSPIHIRAVGPEGLKLGGGVPVPALCGRDLHGGWDLNGPVTAEVLTRTAKIDAGVPGRTCPMCADAWTALHASD